MSRKRNYDPILLKARQVRYYQRNKPKIQAYRRRYKDEHSDLLKTQAHAAYLRNREERIAYATEWRRKNRERSRELIRAKALREIDRHRARGLLKKYVHEGKIYKPTVCAICSTDKGERRLIQGHHPDYSQPLLVTWVCARCHPSLHGY